MWTTDFSEVATRIVQIQLAWLQAAGPISAGLGGVLALAVGIALGRLAWIERSYTALDGNGRRPRSRP